MRRPLVDHIFHLVVVFPMNTLFAALADPRRISILDALRGGGRSVGEIGAVVGMDQATVSKNLRALRDAGLVNVRKDGRRRIYELQKYVFARLAESVASYAEEPATTPAPEGMECYPMLRLLLNARLMRLFYLIRDAGNRGVPELAERSILCRDILALIGSHDGLSWSELVAFSGEEKGQVSRAVKVLSEDGLVSRENLRSKITLSPQGQEVFQRFMALAKIGDDRICAGLSDEDRKRLRAMNHALTERAILLLGEEQALSGGLGSNSTLHRSAVGPNDVPELGGGLGDFITPSLLRLAAYLRRSATMAYRREAGLSNLAWLTLSQVGEHEQLNLTDLATLINRDKGQISRIVSDHKAAGIMKQQRSSKDGKACLVLTAVGKDIYKRMCDRAVKRDEFLFRHILPDERAAYLASLDMLIQNAEAAKAELAALQL